MTKHLKLDSIFAFIEKYGIMFDYVVKPLLMAFIGLALSYHTLWLSSTYVKISDYSAQTEETNKKLDFIISNQSLYKEQLATLNIILADQQKRIDSDEERIRYLERKK
jgi:hypothetical protein